MTATHPQTASKATMTKNVLRGTDHLCTELSLRIAIRYLTSAAGMSTPPLGWAVRGPDVAGGNRIYRRMNPISRRTR
jgi:hypothetical protein